MCRFRFLIKCTVFIVSASLLLFLFLQTHIWSDENLDDKEVIRRFIKIHGDSEVWMRTNWLGIHCLQNPCDMWIMQEIIFEIHPDFIVETGTYKGGSALFFASILSLLDNNGKVITVDIKPQISEVSKLRVFKERVEVIKGDSVSKEVVNLIAERVKGCKVLVMLDSRHNKSHVLKELRLYSKFVSLNSYIVVADTFIDGIPMRKNHVGPLAAVKEFLKTTKDFQIDKDKEKFLLTYFSSGYLRRIK